MVDTTLGVRDTNKNMVPIYEKFQFYWVVV